MSSPQQPHVAKPDAKVTSKGWNGPGITQVGAGWCYAAADQMCQRAFGRDVPQVEIAHDTLLARGRTGDPKGFAVDYYTKVRALMEVHKLNDLGWKFVMGHVNRDKALMDMLLHDYNTPRFNGRKHNRGNAPDPAQIVQTIDAGGLVVIGAGSHFKVVYGYQSDVNGAVIKCMMFNPLKGTDWPDTPWETVILDVNETFYVYA